MWITLVYTQFLYVYKVRLCKLHLFEMPAWAGSQCVFGAAIVFSRPPGSVSFLRKLSECGFAEYPRSQCVFGAAIVFPLARERPNTFLPGEGIKSGTGRLPLHQTRTKNIHKKMKTSASKCVILIKSIRMQ